MVILVKLERPQGAYYGGATAAPVTRATLEAVLAARRAPIDRSALASMARRPDSSPSVPAVRFASRGVEPPAPPSETPADPDGAAIPVPDVSGLTARAAVRRLHALGLRVSWTTDGTISGTHPVAGTRLAPGDTVRLRAYRGDDG
jgi:cell division protein FtsI (penicillin-binding protein 3)